VRTIEQFTAALEFARSSKFVAMLYCDFADTDLYGFAAAKARAASVPLGIATLRINKPGDEESLKTIADCKPDAVLVRNLTALAYFRMFAPDITRIGDFSLNIANELAASVLMSWGVSKMTPSYDLSIDQLRALVNATSPAWFEQAIYDHLPMFHTEHCVAANMLSTGKDNCTCGRPCRNTIELEDAKSLRYQFSTDAACRSTIYHPTVFCAAAHIESLKTIGLRRFRISLLNEDPMQTKTILNSFADLLIGKMTASETLAAITKATRYTFATAPLIR
jgi:putative protease